MGKRERENPCRICGHFHKYEEGEPCGVCGHQLPAASAEKPAPKESAFPSEILEGFLYLGSYDHASRCEVLRILGVSHILNTVPGIQNLYKNTFTYHHLEDNLSLEFDDAIQFIEQCAKDEARVLVHCMTGKSRSPAIVIAYLMKSKHWRLAQSIQWVREHRTQVNLSSGAQQQLALFEQKVFEGNAATAEAKNMLQSDPHPTSVFGFSKPADAPTVQVCNQLDTMSIFEQTGPNTTPGNYVFGAGRTEDFQATESSSLSGSMDRPS